MIQHVKLGKAVNTVDVTHACSVCVVTHSVEALGCGVRFQTEASDVANVAAVALPWQRHSSVGGLQLG